MKSQKGAALIVVLSLLTISLMVGLSSMQSSQIDERLAGNYRAQADAQMLAELAMSEAVELYISGGSLNVNEVENIADAMAEVENNGWDGLLGFDEVYMPSGGTCKGESCAYGFFKDDFGAVFALSMGVVMNSGGSPISLSEPVLVSFSLGGFPFPLVSNAYNVIDDYEYSSSANAKAEEWEKKIAKNPNLFDDNVATTAREFLDFIDFVKLASDRYENVYYFDKDPGKISDYDGLVVIEGDFDWNGRNDFRGLLIVLGRVFDYNGAGNPGYMEGAVLHVPTSDGCKSDVYGSCDFTKPRIEVAGGVGGFRYDEAVLKALRDSLGGGDNSSSSRSISSWQ